MGNTILKYIRNVELITCLYDPYNIIVFDRHVISSTYLMWFNIVFPIKWLIFNGSFKFQILGPRKPG